ncbi:aminotransferase class I/II-fold pyridoxal phosphate-dependent enzyme [Paraburkholderia sp. CNPSo 3157]|uniref:Aminotransferase class I/II-fold pyridoxal phosphate-dependent enzyme n=1 Tax=Paraburkholderia franconis TaxID=2654983 RepID=A0A7X1TFV4_9BURK|nr:PLP-dependent aminotransferase family protein [Paraburkholderia franconis]MPW17621.1 aminotransferase class I/II-fold pyridoxal phosphate-dependent enzyme [Paraburkholderia franconis]
MAIHIAVEGRHDLAGQIYRQLRAGIIEGRLAGGTQLPSTRDLATQLGVSRKTTLDVFERLLAEGFLNARAGSGTFVAEGLQRLPAEHSAHARAAQGALGTHGLHGASAAAQSSARAQPVWSAVPEVLGPQPTLGTSFDFIGGITDKSHFPFDVWRRCVNHALRVQSRGRGIYRDAAGEQELRLAISRYLAFSRAVASNWEDVIVTQGAQHALDLIARVTLRPGDVAVVEDPGYPPARACLTAVGAKVVPVPVDADGLIVSKLPKNTRLVYVTPSHQFPLGMPMSLARRVELLEWAQQRDAVIIEDDYDCEYRFEGRPVEPLKSLDRAGLVAYVGTFSKTIFPELRVGYTVPPASLFDTLKKARQIGDWHGCSLTQTALGSFMLNGDFAKHVKRMHKLYAARRACLLAHLQGGLARWFEPIVPTAGIHLAALLKAPLPEAAVIEAARDESIALHGLAPFFVRAQPRPGLVFGYGGIEAEHIDAALTKLAKLMPRVESRT